MPTVQYYFAQSLDGYIAESNHGLDWLVGHDGDGESDASEATDGTYDEFFAQVGALAMGSATYEVVLEEATSGWPYGGTPAWVFTSRELPVPEGADIRFVSGPVGPALEEMGAAAGDRNVWVAGGGDLAMQFADAGLLDELHITIVPAVLGAGIPAFSGRLVGRLRLEGTRAFGNGMVELRYGFRR
ncbi:MAG TPA: dihydrofolate reductase family protein [Solirubrobacteraceae bacterium]|nr:dihydrofolate reductase family protein [Solirubrobacteraceae bacterium]